MASTSGVGSGTTSASSGTLGNAPPVSFPGVSSGIDYNSIIEKYTADTLLQENPAKNQISNLTAQNTALLKITNLIGSVQDSLTALSNPSTFGAFDASVSNTSSGSPAATASQVAGQTPIAGTYTINAQTAATATTIINNPNANAGLIPGPVVQPAPPAPQIVLANQGTAIVPTNGTGAAGQITINGVAISYNVDTQSLEAIIANINSSAAGTGGGGTAFATLNANGTVTITGVTTIGSGGDQGNLESVLKLDSAQLNGGTITSSSPIAGLNETSVLNQDNNAGFATAVTAGTFTINGVQFTVDPTKNSLSDLITEINSSAAGVTATYNTETSSIQLASTTPGPQSILLGATTDTSNFLTAAGLKTGTTVAGTQASLTYTDQSGQHTVFSSTNDFLTAIPGVDLKVTNSGGSASSTFYTVTVAADPTKAEAAINTFIKAYNAAISELNTDTAAPTVTAGTDATTGTSSSQSTGGGVLYNNYQVSELRDQLVNLVSGFVPSGSTAYNSLQSVGIQLDTSSQTVGTASDDDSSSSSSQDTSSANNSFTVNSTSGKLAALDTTTFEAAYASNPSAIQNLFTLAPQLTSSNAGAPPVPGATYGFSYLLGSALANIDGLATFLTNSVITPDNLASVLLTSLTDTNNQQIDSLQQQITLINNEATNQADSLRTQFSASEAQIAELQALQGQIAAIGH